MQFQQNPRFWQITTLLALILCGAAVIGRGTPVQADNGGAAMDGMIALMGTSTQNDHLYLIDTRTKDILMYESRGSNNFTLVAGRNYGPDLFCLDHAVNKELPFLANGYTTVKIQAAVQQVLAGSGLTKQQP